MKLLLVAIPNHHFFQWTNQLQDAGHEVHWFDITDGAGFSEKIGWVKQYAGWRMKWDYPFRHRIKKYFPFLYCWIQRFNERKVALVFEGLITDIQPDVIHIFEMQLAGYPIFSVLQHHSTIPLVYSSWGSDLFQYEHLGLTTSFVQQFLQRTNFLITDCYRDYNKALSLSFNQTFLGVFPGNGGIHFLKDAIAPYSQRAIIMVKGYDDGVGKALIVLQAIANHAPVVMNNYQLLVYSADEIVVQYLKTSNFYQKHDVLVFSRANYVPNEQILNYMGQSVVHIASSVSDGMPNVVLEAMGMGAFPIQSNPGQVTEEVIIHGKNGFLLTDPESETEIATLLELALNDGQMREQAQQYNTHYIQKLYDRGRLQTKIVSLYSQMFK